MGISDISQSRSWPQGKRSYKLKLQQPVFKVGGDIKSRILMLEWLKVGRKSILFASVLRLWCFRHTEDWGLLRLSQLLGLHSFGDTGWRGGADSNTCTDVNTVMEGTGSCGAEGSSSGFSGIERLKSPWEKRKRTADRMWEHVSTCKRSLGSPKNKSGGRGHGGRSQWNKNYYYEYNAIFLKYSWFTILYWFQVYNIVIQYFYRLYSI